MRSVYQSLIRFDITGLQNATTKKQLKNFVVHLRNTFGELAPKEKPEDWLDAFQFLIIEQIKKALGISGIYAASGSFYHKGNSIANGVQIDLLIDRKDSVINLFELKFYTEPFALTKYSAHDLMQKIASFKALTGTRKQVFLNMLTTYGLRTNEHSIGLVNAAFSVDVLFEKV